MTPLDPDSADRLIKLCGMLGSAHDGERATAAAMADALVRSRNLTWHDVIIAPPIVPDGAPRDDWRRMIAFCHARLWQLTERERQFIHSMRSWRGAPTEKQQDWLLDVYARLHRGTR